MTCEHVKLPGGGTAIVCGRFPRRRRCCACHLVGGFQCDWKVSKTKTCDRYICPEHAQEVAQDKHLCPEHQQAYREWQARRNARGA